MSLMALVKTDFKKPYTFYKSFYFVYLTECTKKNRPKESCSIISDQKYETLYQHRFAIKKEVTIYLLFFYIIITCVYKERVTENKIQRVRKQVRLKIKQYKDLVIFGKGK